METVIIKAVVFYAIIILGYALKKMAFFEENAFKVLSKILINVTLPGAIIMSLANVTLVWTQLYLVLIGLVCAGGYIGVAKLLTRGKTPLQKGFATINFSGYNIGAFAFPFVQSFFGEVATVATALFDVGNGIVCNGGTVAIAKSQVDTTHRFTLGALVRSIVLQVPFLAYMLMLVLALLHLELPKVVHQAATTIGSANTFVAMLMLGLALDIRFEKNFLRALAHILFVRYSVATVISLVIFYMSPLPLEIRQVLAVLVFAPVPIVASAFTAQIKADIELSAAVSSISILISLPIMSSLIILLGVVG